MLRGAAGAGKTYLLDACVAMLMKQGLRVVYIPDCWEAMKVPHYALAEAMLPALAGHESLGDEMWEAKHCFNREEAMEILVWICGKAAGLGVKLLFVIDQAEGLEAWEGLDRYDDDNRIRFKGWLERMLRGHGKVWCTTARDPGFARDCATMEVFGFGKAEVDAFWTRWAADPGKPTLSRWQKDQVEHLTGVLPELLDLWERLEIHKILNEGQTMQTTIKAPPPADAPLAAVARAFLTTPDFQARIRSLIESEFVGRIHRRIDHYHHTDILRNLTPADTATYKHALAACVNGQKIDFRLPARCYPDPRYFTITEVCGNVRAFTSCGIAWLKAIKLLGASNVFPGDCLQFMAPPRNDAALSDMIKGFLASQFARDGMGGKICSTFDRDTRWQLGLPLQLVDCEMELPPRYMQPWGWYAPLDKKEISKNVETWIFVPNTTHGYETQAPADFFIVARSEEDKKGIVVGCKVVVGSGAEEEEEDDMAPMKAFSAKYTKLKEWVRVAHLQMGFLWIREKAWRKGPESGQKVGQCVVGVATVKDVDVKLHQQIQLWRKERR